MKRGRPAMPDGEARTRLTAFKISKREEEAIRRASKSENMDKSEWMRRAVLQTLGLA